MAHAEEYEAELTQLQNEKISLQNQIEKLKSESGDLQNKNKESLDSLRQLSASVQEKDALILELKTAREELSKKQNRGHSRT